MRRENQISVPKLLSKKQAADYFQVSIGTVDNWVKGRKLIAYSLGRRIYFKAEELEEAPVRIN